MNDFISILKKDIIQVSPEEKLASALSKLTTSHDAAFVFTDEKKFMGVVNPYYGLIQSSYPCNAKVEHCLYHPPHIKSSFPLSKIARLLIESKVHYLPVFDDKEGFEGIVSARRILAQYSNAPAFRQSIGDFLLTKNNKLVTIQLEEPINNAIRLFKSTKYSKLIVVDRDMKLKGILSYYDIISFMMSPKTVERKGDKVGGKTNFYHTKVKNFAKTYVLTLTPHHSLHDALQMILEKQIGSVVIIDREKHPVGILTTRDFLRLLIQEDKERKMQFIGKNLSNQSRQVVGGFFSSLQKTAKRLNASSVRLFVKEQKNGNFFDVVLSIFPKKGSPIIIHEEGEDLARTLKKIKKA